MTARGVLGPKEARVEMLLKPQKVTAGSNPAPSGIKSFPLIYKQLHRKTRSYLAVNGYGSWLQKIFEVKVAAKSEIRFGCKPDSKEGSVLPLSTPAAKVGMARAHIPAAITAVHGNYNPGRPFILRHRQSNERLLN